MDNEIMRKLNPISVDKTTIVKMIDSRRRQENKTHSHKTSLSLLAEPTSGFYVTFLCSLEFLLRQFFKHSFFLLFSSRNCNWISRTTLMARFRRFTFVCRRRKNSIGNRNNSFCQSWHRKYAILLHRASNWQNRNERTKWTHEKIYNLYEIKPKLITR